MKIRSKLSGVVWALVGVTLVLSTLFVWGGLRCQYYLECSRLAHQHHNALLSLSRCVDHFFGIVYESFIRPEDAQIDEICHAARDVQQSFVVVLDHVDTEIAFVDADARGPEEEKRERLLSYRDAWEQLEELLVAEVVSALDRSEPPGPRDWQRLLSRTLQFSVGVDRSIREEQTDAHESAARMQELFRELSLTGIIAWSILTLIVGVVGSLLGRSIVTPIRGLVKASHALGGGELTPVERRGNDELAELADAFNTMAAQVESQQLVLLCAKGTVEAKNAQLESEAEARRMALDALQVAKDSADTANRAKSDFLARMSHEIRTPMNGITGMADVLLDGDLSDELRECAKTIRTSAQALLAIVNDVLDFSKIEAGQLQVEHLHFDLHKLADDVVRLLASRAKEKGLKVTVRYPPDAPRQFIGDPGRIRQILVNLLGNAIKFTHEGGVVIEVDCERRSAERGHLVVSVEDTGVGIPARYIDSIFDEFTQADVSTTRRYGGTGLGLSISKGLVKLMGGEIGVTSSPGVGSRFWFSLDLDVGESATGNTRLAGEKAAGEGPSYGLQVLVVDDNAVNRIVAQRLLERLGCSVVTAGSGEESIDVLREHPCDLVFMDCRMPGMDGFQATAAIRELEEGSGRRVPVVAVTANALDGDRETCIRAGMDDYVAKPISMADLRAVLDRWAPDARGGHPPENESVAETREREVPEEVV